MVYYSGELHSNDLKSCLCPATVTAFINDFLSPVMHCITSDVSLKRNYF